MSILAVCVLLHSIAFSPLVLPAARGPREPPPATLFEQLFPRPTGQNGYEEIVAAGEMLTRSALFRDSELADRDSVTLTQKRAILADPPVRDALVLFRQGIAKSLHAPRGNSPETGVSGYGLYRRLARALAMEQYVLCADGRVSQAIDSMQDALRLGYAVQSDTLLGGLVGVAIDALAMSAIQEHVDQLSEKDCRRLALIARSWLNAPDPAIVGLTSERDLILKNMAAQFPADADFPREQILAAMKARVDHYIANLALPYWERKPPLPLQGNALVVEYINALSAPLDPSFQQTQTAFVRDQARMQIVGVHATIRAYRWEHNAYPPGLEQLQLGKLALDPFTGKPLQYRIIGGAAYELTSDGPKKPTNAP